MGGELLMAMFTGVALPVGMMVLKRHYAANPNAWEEIFVFAAVGLVGFVATLWVFSLEAFGYGSLGQVVVVTLCGWSGAVSLYVLGAAGTRAIDTLRETRAK